MDKQVLHGEQAIEAMKKVGLPTPVGVITSLYKEKGKDDVVNVMPLTWWTPCSYDPPRMLFAIGKTKDTLANIMDTGEFVFHLMPFGMRQTVHNCARRLPRNQSEAEYEGLKLSPSKYVSVPHLADALQVVECKLDQIYSTTGTHNLVVGRVLSVTPESVEDPTNVLMYNGALQYSNIEPCITVERY